MNANDISYWDTARQRIAASRERAKAMHEMRAQITAWLRAKLDFGATRPAPRACLDCEG